MSQQWYYSDYERNRLGPVAARDLAELHEAGQLQPDTLVWREGQVQWRPWRDLMNQALAEAAGRSTPVADAVPLSAGVNPYAVAESPVANHALGVDPYAAAAAQSPYAPPRAAVHGSDYVAGGEVVYAGFWKRFAAYAIDSFLMAIVAWMVQAVMMVGMFGAASGDPTGFLAGAGLFGFILGMVIVPLGLQALYFAAMHASAKQATLGKMAVGIKVTDDDGQAISFWRGVGRYFATIVSSLILAIGYFMAGFTERKRALHDMIAGTLVVDEWAFTAHPERQRRELGTVTTVILVISGVLVAGYFLLIFAMVGLGMAAGGG